MGRRSRDVIYVREVTVGRIVVAVELYVAYQIDLTESIPLTLSLGGGAAWLHPIAEMISLGASAEIPVSESFSLRPGLTFDGLWTTADNLRGPRQPSSAILTNGQLPTGGSLFSPSLGINIGFVKRF